MKIQAGIQVLRPKELRRQLQLRKHFGGLHLIVFVLVRNIEVNTARLELKLFKDAAAAAHMKSILTDLLVTPTKPGRMTKPYSSHRFIANCFNAGNLKMEVKESIVEDRAKRERSAIWFDFKLTDESHVFLKVPKKDNMYIIDLKNVVPQRGNISYLTDYEEIYEGFVAFGGNSKGGKVTGKDFKLTDESHVFLKVPKMDNMYIIDLKNVVPQRGYNAVPPPYTRNFMPPKPDLVYPSLVDFVNESVSEIVAKKPTIDSNEPKTIRKENGAPIIKD
nr:hypothetical protein [Tanacetum cinerariifolium]